MITVFASLVFAGSADPHAVANLKRSQVIADVQRGIVRLKDSNDPEIAVPLELLHEILEELIEEQKKAQPKK